MLKNRIIFVLSVLMIAELYLWTDSATALGLLLSVLAIALLSFVLLWLTARSTKVEISHASACRANEDIKLNIRITSTGIHVPIGFLTVRLHGTNPVFREEWFEEAQFDAGWEKTIEYTGFLHLNDYGVETLDVASCRLRDAMGLFSHSVACTVQDRLVVYPPNAVMATTVGRRPRARAMGETFSDRRRGSDVSEVFDIRGYRSGDPVHSIHWKLSSKLDTLMAREFSDPSHYEVLVVGDAALHQGENDIDHKLVSAVAGAQLAIAQNLLRNQVSHSMALSHDYNIDLYPLEGVSDLTGVEELLLSTPLDARYRSMSDRLMDWGFHREFTKVILVTCVYDNESWARLGADTDLTVLIVTPHSVAGASNDNYTLIALDVEGLSDHVHRIDI